jgi:hypothetical protein
MSGNLPDILNLFLVPIYIAFPNKLFLFFFLGHINTTEPFEPKILQLPSHLISSHIYVAYGHILAGTINTINHISTKPTNELIVWLCYKRTRDQGTLGSIAT